MDYLIVLGVGFGVGYAVGRWGVRTVSSRIAEAWHWVRGKFSTR